MREGTMPPAIDDAGQIVAVAGVVSTDAEARTVLLEPASGSYYSLDGVGAAVWRMLRQPRSFRELQEAVLAAYDVTPEQCRKDLLDLLGELWRAGLIEVGGG